jgi:hypothetical protein
MVVLVPRDVVDLVVTRDRGATAAGAGVAAGVLGIWLVWLAKPERGGDTAPLLTGTDALADCIRDRDVVDCRAHGAIDPFPPLQHIPDLVAQGIGLTLDGRVRVLALLSLVGLVAAVVAGWVALRRVGCPEWRWVFLLVAATGTPLAYGNTTWGEMLATGLVTLLVAAALIPAHPALVGLAAFGAGVTKETGYPFVAALGIVALLLARARTGTPIRRRLLLGGAGLCLAVAVASAVNIVRFGTPRNAYYLDPALRTTTLQWLGELSVGLFVAPNGGIVLFWPLATLLVAALLGHGLVCARRTRSWNVAWPALALVAVVIALTVGLAAWWAPFGWWAWGPRLSLPWVLPILLLAMTAYGRGLTPLAAAVLGPAWAAVAAAALIVVVALPHVGLLWRPETIGDFFFFTTTAVCPGGGPPPTPAYYDCLREEMWTRHPILLDALSGVATAGGVVTTGLVTLVAVGCLARFRDEAGAVAVSTRRGPSAPRGSSAQ